MIVLDGAYLVGAEPTVFRRIEPRVRTSCQRWWSGWPSALVVHSNVKVFRFGMPKDDDKRRDLSFLDS